MINIIYDFPESWICVGVDGNDLVGKALSAGRNVPWTVCHTVIRTFPRENYPTLGPDI